MQFGIQNNDIPPAPEVNIVSFNAIALIGIAPKGPKQQLILCANDTQDSQFGVCLTGFGIPRALSTIRSSGGGNVVVVNVFDPSAHTTPVLTENDTVTSQIFALSQNPIPGSIGATATIAVTTQCALNDTLAGLSVNGTALLAAPITFVAYTTTTGEVQIAAAINANTATSGYSAVATTGIVTITGPVNLGCTINGIVTVVGTVVGTLVLGTPAAFANGVGNVLVQNTPVNGVSAVAATTTVTVNTGTGSSNSNTIANLMIGLVNLFSAPLTIASNQSTSQAAASIAAAVTQGGYTATSSGAIITIAGTTAMGASINGVIPVFGAITGTGTLAIGTPGAMGSVVLGVTAVTAVPLVTYVVNQDYTIDDYGNGNFLIVVTDGTVVRSTYNKLNASAVNASAIIGTVNGTTRTGCKLIDTCQIQLQLVPKLLCIPYYNALSSVQTEMRRLMSSYRMIGFAGSTSGMTLAQDISSRGPVGPLSTFNISDTRMILAAPLLATFDPQSGNNTLDDPSAAYAGFLSWNAAVNGPHVSPSNQVMPAVAGTELPLLHLWEDANNAGDTNQLRSNGISCVFSAGGGWKMWGGENSSYPGNNSVSSNISVVYTNHVITDDLTAYAINLIDTNITSGSIQSALNAMNGYYSVLMAKGWIGKDSNIQFLASKNPASALQQGIVTFTRNTYYFVGMKFIVFTENMQVQLPQLSQ